jgi:hypothetical protein
MEPKSYPMLLAEYATRFGEAPPSIFTDEGAEMLMIKALQRGRPIAAADLQPPVEDAPSASAENLRFG